MLTSEYSSRCARNSLVLKSREHPAQSGDFFIRCRLRDQPTAMLSSAAQAVIISITSRLVLRTT